MIHAVKLGEKEITEELLKAGANVNGKDKNNRTALYSAIEKGNYNLVKLLIDHGIKITYFDKKKTPLVHAASLGLEKITKLLIDNGVRLNEVDINNRTALHAAISSNNINIVDLLIQKGININLYDGETTTLLEAVKINNEKIVQLIVDANPILDDHDKKQILENQVNDTVYSKNNTNILNILYRSSIPFEVNLLLGKISSDICYSAGDRTCLIGYMESPIHTAVKANDIELAKILLHKGANINTQAIEVEIDRWDICNILTPMIIACQQGNIVMIKFLLENGANVNIKKKHSHCKDIAQSSALHIATRNNNKEAVKLLLEHGADVDHEDYHGDTALQIAEQLKYIEIANIIKKYSLFDNK
ncbi:MAG: ankyrin repeat protein [Candidatus Magnetoglobus multicellularis str. Araruama]|uniref:Ankyrin repeat protein n=1 Tax=Candidatus Magnetoglobus multicellularis str. Araruama TaxID=890399 RepID=A0A1V1P5C2_9BACT|nr:MAG: ankyrin repeat protein [Candidatus Magnetoglobus multicellularis str. Araruama]